MSSTNSNTSTAPAPPRFSRVLFALLKFAIPVGIIAFLLSAIPTEDWELIAAQPKSYGLLTAALLVALVAMSLSFARWCVLVRCQGIELSMIEAFRLGSICFLLSFVSAGSVGGDLFKAIFLAKRRPGKRVEAVASVLVDRGVGLYGLLLLVSVALLLGQTGNPDDEPTQRAIGQIRLAASVLIGLGTAVLAVLILGGKQVDRMIDSATQWPFLGRLLSKAGPPLRMFHHHPTAFAFSIVLSLAVHSLLTVSMFLIATGLYESTPTLSEHFVIVPIGMLASAIPIAPAGLGVLEATIEWLYRVVPAVATNARGTLVALVFEIVKFVMAILGTIFYWTAGAEVRDSLEQEVDETEWMTAGPASISKHADDETLDALT